MRFLSLATSLLCLLCGLAVAGGGPRSSAPKSDPKAAIARGEYLVRITGCGDCHSPMGPMGKRIPGREFTGHPEGMPLPAWNPNMLSQNILMTSNPTATAFAGPWGVSVAGNLTPDKETGIGNLTATALIKSWRSGKHWKFDNRPVLPPMPMEAYVHLTEEDIEAIFAYLSSLKPVKNMAPPSVVNPNFGKG